MESKKNKEIDLEELENVNGGNIIMDASQAVVDTAVNVVDSVFNKLDDTLVSMIKDDDSVLISDDPRKAKPTRLI